MRQLSWPLLISVEFADDKRGRYSPLAISDPLASDSEPTEKKMEIGGLHLRTVLLALTLALCDNFHNGFSNTYLNASVQHFHRFIDESFTRRRKLPTRVPPEAVTC